MAACTCSRTGVHFSLQYKHREQKRGEYSGAAEMVWKAFKAPYERGEYSGAAVMVWSA